MSDAFGTGAGSLIFGVFFVFLGILVSTGIISSGASRIHGSSSLLFLSESTSQSGSFSSEETDHS